MLCVIGSGLGLLSQPASWRAGTARSYTPRACIRVEKPPPGGLCESARPATAPEQARSGRLASGQRAAGWQAAPLAGLASPQRARLVHAGANGRMEAQPFDPSSFFQDTPPPSWSSPEWKWGSEDGVAHTEAEKARAEFAKQFRRSSLLSWAKLGSADYVELKMVLALKCQHARLGGYDAPDGRSPHSPG